MIKRIMYGAMGFSVSALIVTNLLVSQPETYIATAHLQKTSNESTVGIEEDASQNNKEESIFHTYHVSNKQVDKLKTANKFSLGRTNPMYYWTHKKENESSPTSENDKPTTQKDESDADEETNLEASANVDNQFSWEDYIKSQKEKEKKELGLKKNDQLGIRTAGGPADENQQIQAVNTEKIEGLFKEYGTLPTKEKHFHKSSDFGPRIDPINNKSKTFHSGIDIASKGIHKQPVFSLLPGVISNIGFDELGYGNYIEINHGDYSSLYAHLHEKPNVKVGDEVEAGDQIGIVGSTGRSTGPHLHLEFSVGDTKINPEVLFKNLK